jgi:type I restriction enzyme S subunit
VRNNDTFLDCLPEDWNIAKIGAVFDIKQGKSLSSRKQTGKHLKPFLRTSNVFWGRLDLSNLDEMDFTDDECKALTLKYDDLLVCEGGDIGRTAIWRNEKPDCYYQNHLHRLRIKDEKIEPLFVMYWMQVALTQLGIYDGFGNKTTIPNLSSSRLKEFILPVPEKKEQQKIAAVLYKIQKAIEVQESIIEKTRELKKSTLHHVFTHGLRGEKLKETEIGPMPESWSVQRFEEFATLHRGYDLPIQNRKKGSIPIVGSNGVVGYHNQSKVKGPGVVTGRSGSIGISYYVEVDYWPLNTGLYVEDFHGNDPLYVHCFFQSFDFGQFAAGVSVPTLNRNLVHTVLISVPSIGEQKEIANILKIIDQKIDIHTARKFSIQDLFKTMLNKLMTGEIRVKDLDIDVSEVST